MQVGAIMGFDGTADPRFVAEAGQLVEELGFDALWVPEHVLFFPEYASRYPYSEDGKLRGDPKSVFDPFTILTWLAAHTTRVRLATGICIVPQRDPVYLAKNVAELDRLSGGRFDFGVGVGWQREEYDALGIDFDSRGRRMGESLDLMKALWTEDVTTWRGELFDVRGAWAHPKPLQSPHPPILVGGESAPALRRVAERGDGWYGFDLTPEDCARHLSTISGHLEARGESLSDRRLVVSPAASAKTPESVSAFARYGVEQVVFPVVGRDLAMLRERGERALALAR